MPGIRDLDGKVGDAVGAATVPTRDEWTRAARGRPEDAGQGTKATARLAVLVDQAEDLETALGEAFLPGTEPETRAMLLAVADRLPGAARGRARAWVLSAPETPTATARPMWTDRRAELSEAQLERGLDALRCFRDDGTRYPWDDPELADALLEAPLEPDDYPEGP